MNIITDDLVYYPLGGASYIFKDDFLKYIKTNIHKKNVIISIGAQPNSSPHFGTLCVFSLAFSLASAIFKFTNVNCSVLFEVVDTAPGEQMKINNIIYQKNLKYSSILEKYMPEFIEILDYFSQKSKIKYKIRYQKDFNKQDGIVETVDNIIKNQKYITKLLDASLNKLRIRISCPKCGLTDKYSIKNKYKSGKIHCFCPEHGDFVIDYHKHPEMLEYNTPLRNLIRAIIYGKINESNDYDYQIIRITGNDYAGFYQEELLYKVGALLNYNITKFPIIVYCPLVTDWSGAKLSKSLYVKEGAYKDLPKYLINYKFLKEEYGTDGLKEIKNITDEWINEPYKLFRDYSIYYFMKRFNDDIKK